MTPPPPQSCRKRRWGGRFVLRVLWINLAAAVTASLLFIWFQNETAVGAWARILATSLIYSFAIGTPAAAVLPVIGERTYGRSFQARLAIYVATILALTTVGCLTGGGLVVALGLSPGAVFWKNFFFLLRFSALIALTFGLGAIFYETTRVRLEETTLQLRTRQLEEERARKLAAEARLSSLESRIHPHFLFNTLNSIASLIPEDPRRAEDMIARLATLLRFSLDSSQQSLTPLAQELRVVADYLEIERARLGGRLRYSIDVPGELEAIEVPPLALQSLVENSVKHAIAPRREGGEIRVEARAADGCVVLEVADTGPGFNLETAPPGHGLDNLQARLHALFGAAAALETERREARSVVRIRLRQPAPVGSS
jgi:two-component system sensor histidine kinase AlgZ